jgi:hypothetical protein
LQLDAERPIADGLTMMLYTQRGWHKAVYGGGEQFDEVGALYQTLISAIAEKTGSKTLTL